MSCEHIITQRIVTCDLTVLGTTSFKGAVPSELAGLGTKGPRGPAGPDGNQGSSATPVQGLVFRSHEVETDNQTVTDTGVLWSWTTNAEPGITVDFTNDEFETQFAAEKAGLYRVNAEVPFRVTTGSGQFLTLALVKNGTIAGVIEGSTMVLSGTGVSQNVTYSGEVIVQLDAGETISLGMILSSTPSRSVIVNVIPATFRVYRVG